MSFRLPLFAVLLGLYSNEAFAYLDLWVGTASGCLFTSIQTAVAFASTSNDANKSIWLLANETYSEKIRVDNQNLSFRGGIAGCGSYLRSTGATSTIDGSGGADASAVSITGTGNVTMSNLAIQGGHAGSGSGGGINFVGNGMLELDNVAVILNSAMNGGGINVNPGSGIASGSILLLGSGSQVNANNAYGGSGAGIQLGGYSHLYATGENTLIAFNHALNGNGGGLRVTAPAQASIGSPGFSGLPVIYANTAYNGGGISIEGADDAAEAAQVQLYTTSAANPVSVGSNVALNAGGAVYLMPNADSGSRAVLFAYDYRIDDNIATDGAAFFLGSTSDIEALDEGGEVYLNGSDKPDFSVRCAAGVACNEVSRNIASANGQRTPGSTVVIGTNGDFVANGLIMQGNIARYLFNAIGDNDDPDDVHFTLRNCLTGGNQTDRELIRLENDDNHLILDQCTFAPDLIQTTHVITFDNVDGNRLTLTNSIIDEPGTLALSYPGSVNGNSAIVTNYLLTNDTTTLPANPTMLLGTPHFADEAHGDYHQLSDSPGVDFAPAAAGTDLDGNVRTLDLYQKPNRYGPMDLGAYERIYFCAADTIFCNGFDR